MRQISAKNTFYQSIAQVHILSDLPFCFQFAWMCNKQKMEDNYHFSFIVYFRCQKDVYCIQARLSNDPLPGSGLAFSISAGRIRKNQNPNELHPTTIKVGAAFKKALTG